MTDEELTQEIPDEIKESQAYKDLDPATREYVNPEEFAKMHGIELPEKEAGDDKPPETTGGDVEKVEKETETKAQGEATGEKETETEKIGGYTLEELGLGDRFKSVEELKNANIPQLIAERDALNEQKEAFSKWQEEKQEYERRFKEITDPFADEDIAKYNSFVKETGIKNFSIFDRISKADVDQIDDVEAIKLARMIDSPKLASMEDKLTRQIQKVYQLGQFRPEDEEELDDTKEVDLIAEADRARGKIREMQQKGQYEKSEPEPIDVEKTKNELREKWSGALSEIKTKALNKFPVRVDGRDEPVVEYEFTQDDKEKFVQRMDDFIVTNRLPANRENLQMAYQVAMREFEAKNAAKLNKLVFEKARSMTDEEWHKEANNPGLEGGDKKPPEEKKRDVPEGFKTVDEVYEDTVKDYR